MTNMKTFPEIAATFAPYHTLAAFQIGTQDYMDNQHSNPYGTSSVDAQAWDRGAMAASLFTRQYEPNGKHLVALRNR